MLLCLIVCFAAVIFCLQSRYDGDYLGGLHTLRYYHNNFVTKTDVFSTGLDVSSGLAVIDDDDVEVKSALGRKTMTVFPTVVTNSSNPKTVLVVTPENCHNQTDNCITHEICLEVCHSSYPLVMMKMDWPLVLWRKWKMELKN